MTMSADELSARLTGLERQVHRLRLAVGASLLVVLGLATTAFVVRPAAPDLIRTRQLIIEDDAGRDRIILGAPMRDNFRRVSPATGMAIRDTLGQERFGLSLDARGNMGLGLDAPRCTSDPCNRERINLVADAAGGSQLRFLDRQTGVAARLFLAADDRVYLDFLRVTRDSIRSHRRGLAVDSTFAEGRR
jgi:hypothetical protein